MAKVLRNCECCGNPMMVRTADISRGWGKYCSKSCKATAQERRTHQYHNYLGSGVSRDVYLEKAKEYGGIPQFDHRGEYAGFLLTAEGRHEEKGD